MSTKTGSKYEDDMAELRRGPWTLEEDTLLIHYIACHGEGRWNQLARCSGLKRTGKSCRLRWLNYLKPDVKRGNLTPEEQILILELHSKWGNRWSRIAQHLPGRTDNEIKNYWRTRVQKQARQLKIDANSAVFRDAVRCFWMPRLLEKMATSSSPTSAENLNPNYYADLLGHAPHQEAGGLFVPHPALLISTDLQAAAFVNSKQACYDSYELSGLENSSPCVSSETTTTMGGAVQPSDAVQEFSQTASDPVGNLLLQQYGALLGGHHGYSSGGQVAPAGVVAPTVPASCSGGAAGGSSVYDYSVLANCGADNNTLEYGLWSNMDELWQARKLENWGI